MSRKAILIEASSIKGHDDLPGARVDVENYSSFLQSPIGGLWLPDEIEILRNPTRLLLKKTLLQAKIVDYAMVAFSGHGYHAHGRTIDETRVCLNDNEEASVQELNPGNERCAIIADCCRKVTEVLLEKRAWQFSVKAHVPAAANPAKCRRLFDLLVETAEKGPIYVYSCGLNEAAGDIPSFSQALVEFGENWGENQSRSPSSLKLREAFDGATAIIQRPRPQQHPHYDGGRRKDHFPFAVFST
jgi:hypothetical protein